MSKFLVVGAVVLLLGSPALSQRVPLKDRIQHPERSGEKEIIELIKQSANDIIHAADQGNYHMVLREVRQMIRKLPAENVKMIGIDFNAWTLKLGTATYMEGEFTDITMNPLWQNIRDYAHILHNSGEHVSGVGFVKGSKHITKDNAIDSVFRRKEVPSIATKVLVHGDGDIDVTGAEETKTSCTKLRAEWTNIVRGIGKKVDEQTLLVLTDEYYCPTALKELAGDVYRMVEVQSGYANDGTPIDVVVGLKREHEKDPDNEEDEEIAEESWLQQQTKAAKSSKDFQ